MDPTWTFMLPWVKDDNYQILEYACVEGELSVSSGLAAERMNEARREPPKKPRMRDGSDRNGVKCSGVPHIPTVKKPGGSSRAKSFRLNEP